MWILQSKQAEQINGRSRIKYHTVCEDCRETKTRTYFNPNARCFRCNPKQTEEEMRDKQQIANARSYAAIKAKRVKARPLVTPDWDNSTTTRPYSPLEQQLLSQWTLRPVQVNRIINKRSHSIRFTDSEAGDESFDTIIDYYEPIMTVSYTSLEIDAYGMSYREIGERLGFSEGLARKIYRRGIEKMKLYAQPSLLDYLEDVEKWA